MWDCKKFYSSNLLYAFGEPNGSPSIEIEKLEKELERPFPEAYRQFLLWMGDDVFGPLRGSEWFLKDLRDNNEYLPDLLEDNAISFDSSKKYLCFFSHQGYMAGWFHLDNPSPDPDCLFFSEGNAGNTVANAGRFTDFLYKELEAVHKATL